MKDQKAILHKCLRNDWPAFVIAGTDICAIETMEAYLEIAKTKGCSQAFLDDMQLVIDEMKHFQQEEPEHIKIPD
ncbi:hypothetical protein KDU71_20070 [Carboxylicivirga sediminis]|uniref:Uncharacterized protein n=1 Tax=Carboxylicivirga sediminis TaxID=2006564 RepID=A0A941F7G0_9BACT|nr:hypothetical protein [Carboxylicivirga sediminis]MBR8537879.1 hypothetical protein [Carboxylicivirga sediminis]